MPPSTNEAETRLVRLRSYLASDPDNIGLLSDAAEAALEARLFEDVRALLERRNSLVEAGARERSMLGLALMGQQLFEEAIGIFEPLVDANPNDASLRFNLAWSLAQVNASEQALDHLTPEVTSSLAQAAMLEVQLLHKAERIDEALEKARQAIERHPDYGPLLAITSVVAIDGYDRELAAQTASRAGDHPDALITLGLLALDEENASDAENHFSRVLSRWPDAPRALLGRGLSRMAGGDTASALADLERSAALFDTHIGTWLAAGWARLVMNDLEGARQHFERALAIDPAFGETQGSLAVLCVLEGDTKEAETFAQKASRLDRQSFSAALAHALLANAKGKPEIARALIERAFHTPLDSSGKTLTQSLTRFGLLA